jgi:hypothetical protein
MRNAKNLILLAALAVVPLRSSAPAQAQRPITIQDFEAVKNIGDPQISPDGKWVLYSVRTTNLDANRRSTVTVVQATAGGTPRQFPE